MKLVHILTSYFSTIHFNIIIQSNGFANTPEFSVEEGENLPAGERNLVVRFSVMTLDGRIVYFTNAATIKQF